MLFQIGLAVAIFTGIVVSLSAVILLARSRLVETGVVEMVVNDDRDFQVSAGVKLLTALSNAPVLKSRILPVGERVPSGNIIIEVPSGSAISQHSSI